MNKKIITGTFVFMLISVPILSLTATADQEPELEIGKISGHRRSLYFFGPSVVVEIKNAGDVDATDVTWSFRIKHPRFEKLDITGEYIIDNISAGESFKEIATLSWIGRFEITVTASVSGGNTVEKTVHGYSFGLGRFFRIFSE